jgi:UDP:flavonoid glycosyltransferase YjiC (YdhE family)
VNIFITTVGTTGDVQPFLALAAHLSAAGHRVCACSHAFYRSTFDTLGIEFVPIGPPIDQETIQAVGEKAAREKHSIKQMEVLRDFHLLDGREHYNRCREATMGFDVAVCHAIHTIGQAAVMDNELPWIRVMLEPSLLPTVYAAPTPLPNSGRHLNRLLWYLLERLMAKTDAPLHQLLEAVESRQTRMKMFRTPSPYLNLVACSRYLCEEYADLPTNYRFTGAWLSDAPEFTPSPSLEQFLDEKQRPIVISFGSMAGGNAESITRILLDAVAETGQPAIIQRGAANLDTRQHPETVLFVDYVPHQFLFARASCVVHHGGAGTTTAACYAGVPSIVVPHIGDQHYWGYRLHKIGVAPKPLPWSKLTATRLANRIREATTSQRMAMRVGECASRMRLEGGLEEAVPLIEQIASREFDVTKV